MEGGYSSWADSGLTGDKDKPSDELKVACKFRPWNLYIRSHYENFMYTMYFMNNNALPTLAIIFGNYVGGICFDEETIEYKLVITYK